MRDTRAPQASVGRAVQRSSGPSLSFKPACSAPGTTDVARRYGCPGGEKAAAAVERALQISQRRRRLAGMRFLHAISQRINLKRAPELGTRLSNLDPSIPTRVTHARSLPLTVPASTPRPCSQLLHLDHLTVVTHWTTLASSSLTLQAHACPSS